MSNDQRSLTQRLAEAEATIAALVGGQIDAVLHAETSTPLLLAAAQEALRESERRYRRILETANEGIVTIDQHSTITFVNQRVTHILGYSIEDMLGKSLLRFVSEARKASRSLKNWSTALDKRMWTAPRRRIVVAVILGANADVVKPGGPETRPLAGRAWNRAGR